MKSHTCVHFLSADESSVIGGIGFHAGTHDSKAYARTRMMGFGIHQALIRAISTEACTYGGSFMRVFLVDSAKSVPKCPIRLRMGSFFTFDQDGRHARQHQTCFDMAMRVGSMRRENDDAGATIRQK